MEIVLSLIALFLLFLAGLGTVLMLRPRSVSLGICGRL